MTRYKFDEIAFNSTVKKKPVEEDKYTYLGLEHLDSGSLQVTRFGSDVAPKGEKLLMKKGDVLFGKRRAYQKKVAIAPFDGIFSAHGMVLRPREEVITREFFPFFISSDYFLDNAIKISVGSLSPTINWRDLKKLEFELPSLDEQKKLAEVLWAAEEENQAIQKAIKEADAFLQNYVQLKLFDRNNKPISLKELVTINRSSIRASSVSPDFEFQYIDIAAVIAPKTIDYSALKNHTFDSAPSRARRRVETGDILMSSVRPNLQSFAIVSGGEYIASTGFITMTPKEDYLQMIVFQALFSKTFMRYCADNVTGTNYPAISAERVGEFNIYLPDKHETKLIAEELFSIQKLLDTLINKGKVTKDLLKQLTNEI